MSVTTADSELAVSSFGSDIVVISGVMSELGRSSSEEKVESG